MSDESLSSVTEDESEGSDSETTDTDTSLMPVPYSYEPSYEPSSSSSSEDSDDETALNRLSDLTWCSCEHCAIMTTNEECVCCREIPKICEKINALENSSIVCIINHPGFSSVCLDVWVLQAAYFQYKQEYGVASAPSSLHEKYRYTAYRQLIRWCWGWLGRNIRVVLPACAVKKIRDTFSSESYTGFKYPTLS